MAKIDTNTDENLLSISQNREETLWDKILMPLTWFRQKCRDAYWELKYGFQRFKRGYSVRDTWDIGHWLISLLPPMIKTMRRTNQGVPLSFFKEFDKDGKPTDDNDALKRYNAMLGDILNGLESARILDELDYDFRSDSKTYVHKLESEVQKSFTLIGKHLNHLWN